MNPKGYLTISSLVFLVVAVLHVLRIAFQVPIQIGSWLVPGWLSYLGAPIALGLSFWAFSLRESVTRVE
jgi:hypothetical protein